MTLHQCLDTEVHPPHDFCPGLDGTEVPATHDPMSVTCPSCSAPPTIECDHADRVEAARLAAAEWGTCALCLRAMVRLTAPDDALHPHPDDAAACPPMPPPEQWNAHAEAVNAGLTPGHPGLEHWRPEPSRPSGVSRVDWVGPDDALPPGFQDGDTLNGQQVTLLEQGRRLASERDDLIADGVDPGLLVIPDGMPLPDLTGMEHPPAAVHASDPLCPECAQGKVANCAQQALSADDELVPCTNAGITGLGSLDTHGDINGGLT